jgi:putative transposase
MGRKATYIELTEQVRQEATDFVKTGSHNSREIQRAQVLLLNDKGNDIKTIMDLLDLSRPSVSTVLSRYRKAGLLSALKDKPRIGAPVKITAQLEAHVTALVCSDAPKGRCKWTLELLHDKVIQLNYVESISDESIRTILKKVNLSLGRPNNGVLAQ